MKTLLREKEVFIITRPILRFLIATNTTKTTKGRNLMTIKKHLEN